MVYVQFHLILPCIAEFHILPLVAGSRLHIHTFQNRMNPDSSDIHCSHIYIHMSPDTCLHNLMSLDSHDLRHTSPEPHIIILTLIPQTHMFPESHVSRLASPRHVSKIHMLQSHKLSCSHVSCIQIHTRMFQNSQVQRLT